MTTEHIPLLSPAPGSNVFLTVHRFGERDARPRVYVQAALHADEIPGMMVAHHLRNQLSALEREGRIKGEIILVPSANPLGLAQRLLGQAIGRFNLADGVNFNRGYPSLVDELAEAVKDRLTENGPANVSLIRETMRQRIERNPAKNSAEDLKKTLLGLAFESDLVLDLHCDAEAVMHLYTHTRSSERFAPLAALLGARAVLLAEISGDDPFDEACSRPWAELADRFPEHAIPFACHSATVEFRGERDVDQTLGGQDAAVLIQYFTLIGAIAGPSVTVPPAQCSPTPLAGSEQVQAPASGIVAFQAKVGDRLKEGETVAVIVDPLTGLETPVSSPTEGVMFARIMTRFITKGQPLAKVAGTNARRTGKLLGA